MIAMFTQQIGCNNGLRQELQSIRGTLMFAVSLDGIPRSHGHNAVSTSRFKTALVLSNFIRANGQAIGDTYQRSVQWLRRSSHCIDIGAPSGPEAIHSVRSHPSPFQKGRL